MRRVVIVGYGMAGARLADELRRRDSEISITVIGAEPHAAYNRVLLSTVVAGSMTPASTRLHDDRWAAEHRVDLRVGREVSEIDRANRTITVSAADDSDETIPYDALVLATGSTPWVPPAEGLLEDGKLASGVVAFRTLDDCAEIEAKAHKGAPVVVLGGGLL